MSQKEQSPQEKKRDDAYAGIVFGSLFLLPTLCVVFSGGPGWLILLGFFGSMSAIISGICQLKELNEHK